MRPHRDQPAPLERSAVRKSFYKVCGLSPHDFIRIQNREVKLWGVDYGSDQLAMPDQGANAAPFAKTCE